MKSIFLIGGTALIILEVLCIYFTSRQKSRYSKTISILYVTGMITMISYYMAIEASDPLIASICFSFYSSSIDFVLFFMLNFSLELSNRKDSSRLNQAYRYVLLALCILDSISLFSNLFTNAVLKLSPILINGKFAYWSLTYGIQFYIHLAYSFFLVATIFYELIKSTVKSPKFYRIRYIWILVSFAVLIAVNILFILPTFSAIPLDFSIWMYPILSIEICFVTFKEIPKELGTNILTLVSQNISTGIVFYDLNGKCIYINHAASILFETASKGVKVAERYNKLFYKANKDLGDDVLWANENFLIGGETHNFMVSYYSLKDKKGRYIGNYIKLDDRTEEIHRYKEQKQKASHDPLTGLLNRNAFFSQATNIIKENPNISRYLIATNIKNFKVINDRFGAEFGDKILIEQAKALSLAYYGGCISARISGDRFAMLIPKANFNMETAIRNTNRINHLTEDSNYKIEFCLGIYEIADPHEPIQSMYDKASLAVDSIRDNYDRVVAYYDKNLMDHLKSEKNIISEFSHALSDGQFRMYLQPQVTTSEEKVIGAEALVRWNHPALGIISPAVFVKVLENSGFIHQLDAYIWEQAAKKLSEWKTRGIDMHISVNISAKDFYHIDVYKTFVDLTEKYQIDSSKLNLEITETVLMNESSMTESILNKLRNYGFKIEMDDFGSGYSSLNTLLKTKMEILKIDMEFLRRTGNEERAKGIIGAIINMAKTLGMTVICEGVETYDQADFLKRKGCDIFQGYYYSKPISVEDFEKKYIGEPQVQEETK